MPKKQRVRTVMESQHVKVSQRLLKSARQYFCHIFSIIREGYQLHEFCGSSMWNLRLFVSILTRDEKYSFSVKARL